MKEQLERMFPGAVVTTGAQAWGNVIDGPVTIRVRKPAAWRFTAQAEYGHFGVGVMAYAVSPEAAIKALRDIVEKASVAPGSKAARDRAARVLRVLDAAKVGEVTP